MEYVDLKGFEEFVAKRDLVPEAHRSFYMHWVRRFLRESFDADELANKDKVECFSDQLARDSSVKDWQLRQALQAVSLYLDVYLRDRHEMLGTRGSALECGDTVSALKAATPLPQSKATTSPSKEKGSPIRGSGQTPRSIISEGNRPKAGSNILLIFFRSNSVSGRSSPVRPTRFP